MDQSRAAVKARMADAQPIRPPRQGERPGANTEYRRQAAKKREVARVQAEQRQHWAAGTGGHKTSAAVSSPPAPPRAAAPQGPVTVVPNTGPGQPRQPAVLPTTLPEPVQPVQPVQPVKSPPPPVAPPPAAPTASNGAPGQAPESPASAYIGSKAGFASISDGRYEGQRDNGSRFSGTVDRAPTRDLTEKVTEINAATEAVRDLRNAQREAQGYRPVGQRSTNPVHVAPNSHADQWNAKRLANDMKNDMKGMRPRAAAAYMMGRKPAPARTPQAEPEQPREPRPANDYYTKRQFEQQDAAAERTQEASLAAAEAQASAAEKAAELMADEQSATRQHTRALEIEGIKQNGLDKRAQADRSAKVDDAVYKGLADQFAGDGLTEDPALHERAGVAQGMAGQLLKAYPGRFSAGQLTAAISNATRTMPTLADAENEARAQGGSDEEIQIRASEIYRGYQDSAAQSINKTLGL